MQRYGIFIVISLVITGLLAIIPFADATEEHQATVITTQDSDTTIRIYDSTATLVATTSATLWPVFSIISASEIYIPDVLVATASAGKASCEVELGATVKAVLEILYIVEGDVLLLVKPH